MTQTEQVISKRLEWIDISKGVGIIVVILCHSMIPMHGDPYLYSAVSFMTGFVMVMFFVLAGMTYNADKHRENLKQYAISRGRQLLIPYFAIYLIMTLLFIPLTGSIDTYLTPGELIFWLLYGAGPPGQPTYLWFLPVLYFGLLLFIMIESVTRSHDPRVRWPLVVLLPLVALLIKDVFSPLLVPWRLNSVLYTTAFCIVGHEMRRYRGLKAWRTNSKIRDAIVVMILFVVWSIPSLYNGFVSMVDDAFGVNGWIYLITGISGSIVIFMLSSTFDSSSISRRIQFLGINSQTLYEIHPIFFYLIPPLVALFGWSYIDYNSAFTLFWPLRFVVAFGLSVPFAYLVLRNRVLSVIFTGKSNK
ncbi:MAG: acyltransferase family protein [Candidatus Thorarchaeota archaeon]|jgi:fucose 4-O-acetylase-like acetyltransferase